MKKIIITILALVVFALALMAGDVIFKDGNNTKSPDVYGYIYKWDGHHYVVDVNANHYVHLIYGDADIYFANGSCMDEGYVMPTNGYYEWNIAYPYNMAASDVIVEYDEVTIVKHKEPGESLHIDIYLPKGDGPYPTPDNTIPAEQ